jgi:hypothetical protein
MPAIFWLFMVGICLKNKNVAGGVRKRQICTPDQGVEQQLLLLCAAYSFFIQLSTKIYEKGLNCQGSVPNRPLAFKTPSFFKRNNSSM